LIGLLACWAAIAAPAHPASQRDERPAIVARDGAALLSAHDDDDSLCLGVARQEADAGSSCSDPAGGIVVLGDVAQDGGRHVGVALAAPIARVEVRRAGRVLASGPTTASPAYRGRYAATVRFALVRLPVRARTDALRIHAFDAAGTLVSVFASGHDDDRVFDRRRLLSGRSHRLFWSIVSSRASSLKPTVFDLARESLSRCAEVRVQSSRGGGESSRSCDGDEPRDGLNFAGAQPDTKDLCHPDFRLVHGVAAAAVRRVTVLLGDGRRVGARTASLPGGAYRVYAVEIDPHAAVRRVELRTPTGPIEVRRLDLAPLAVTCAPRQNENGAFSISSFRLYGPDSMGPRVTPRGPVSTLPGPPTVRIADGPGDTLCVALGDRPFTALGCALVSPDLSEPLAVLDSFTKPRSFAFALPARVATMRIAGPNGTGTRDIPTVSAAGYSGIYAPHVRFATGTLSSNRELGRVDLLDAAGTVLHSQRASAAALTGTSRLGRPRRIAGRVGGPSLWQTRISAGAYRARCLALTTGPPPPEDVACGTTRSDGAVLLAASCATHRLTVAVAFAAGARVFADTGAASARRFSLRDGAGLLTLAPGSPLRSLTIIQGRRTRRVALAAPPGDRQCGWTATPLLGLR
jgi:hypothetical protein